MEALLSIYDGDFKAGFGSLTAWSGQLRLTLEDPPNEPARSVTFYAAGQPGPDEVAAATLEAFGKWRKSAEGVEPAPVPEWIPKGAA
jgi:hypothetical protein